MGWTVAVALLTDLLILPVLIAGVEKPGVRVDLEAPLVSSGVD
jgi:hypothetical protein